MTDEAGRLHDALARALAAHAARAKEPWSGPYHFRGANEEIGRARRAADAFLSRHGLTGKAFFGNAECLRLLADARGRGR